MREILQMRAFRLNARSRSLIRSEIRELAFRFAQDLGVSITAYSALVLWPLGEVDRAREVAEEMVARDQNRPRRHRCLWAFPLCDI